MKMCSSRIFSVTFRQVRLYTFSSRKKSDTSRSTPEKEKESQKDENQDYICNRNHRSHCACRRSLRREGRKRKRAKDSADRYAGSSAKDHSRQPGRRHHHRNRQGNGKGQNSIPGPR